MKEFTLHDEEFWRQLEWLSLQLISSKLNGEVKIDKFDLTKKRNDGGFDGEITIDITKEADINHKIIFESKFRTSIKSLPLDDCAKALIIAFNKAAQTLYIVTNVLFSPQTENEISKFKKKINLTVVTVDGNSLREYVSKNKEALLEKCSEDFLSYIENSSNINIDIKIDNLNKKNKKKIIKKKRSTSEHLGSTSKEQLFQTNFFKKESENYIKHISTNSKFTLLSGEAGIGKSVFLTETLRKLECQEYSTTMFDLQQYATPRILFIKFLESLWETDLSEFTSKFDYKAGVENLKPLIEYNADGKISENLLSAVIQAICKRTEDIKGYADNYYFLLAHYIFLLLKPYADNNKIVWAFTDLNKAGVETLNFLYTLLCEIKGIISVIVEVRPEFVLETVSPELVTRNYYALFKSISNTPYTINFTQFSYPEAREYLETYLSNMSDELLNIIINKVGTLPLYLNTAANYIKTQLQNSRITPTALPERTLKNWISEYKKNENTIILNSLSYYRKNSDIEFCFGITGLLDGCLPIAIIEAIYSEERQSALNDSLDSISFYKFKSDAYYVKHDYIYDTIKESMSDRLRYITAQKIYDCAQNPNVSFEITEEKALELLYFMQEYEKALEKWFYLEKKLYREHLFCSIIHYGNIALECYENLKLTNRDHDVQIKIITAVLNAYLQIRVLNAEEFNRLLLQYETICNLKKYSSDGATLKARYLFYKWNQFFYSANIEESYETISKAKDMVDEKNIDDMVLCANIYWAYALSHKRKSTIGQAIEDYKEGLLKYPNSTILNVGLKLHQAHTYLRKEPEKSCKICRSILSNMKEDDCPYHEILQTRIDIVMSEFYASQYTQALKDCEEVLQIARSVDASYQMGRLYNIYAASLLMQGNTEAAEINFERSYYEFKESGNELFAWRADFNLSQVLLRLGKEKKAVGNLKALYNGGIPNLKERIRNLTLENAEMTAFLYIVRILKEKGLYKENKTAKLLQYNEIYIQMLNCDNETFSKELKQLSFLHGNYLIILG